MRLPRNRAPAGAGMAFGAGVILGTAAGAGLAAVNRYVQSGLYRSAWISLRDAADRGAIWGLAAAAGGVIVLLAAAAGKRGGARAARTAVLTALAGLLLYATDLLLRFFTIYNLPGAAGRILKRLGELAGGRRAASYLWELPGRHPEILILGAGVAGGIVLLYLAAGRWSRRWSGRGGIVVGGGALLVLAVLNLVPFFFPAPAGPNVLLIVVDCLRADRLEDSADVPNLTAFARESLRFPRVWANAPWTKPAVASLLSSLPPTRHGAMNPLSALPRGITTLPEIFREYGYRTFFINGGNPNLTREFGFGQGFDRLEVTDRRFGPDCNRALFRRLNRTGNEPFFGLVHYMDLHLPYNVNPDNPPPPAAVPDELRPGTLDYDRVIAAGDGEPVRSYLRALYRGQLHFVDSLLGEVFRELERTGRADDTIVAVTGDHGEELWEHGGFGHGHSLYNELLAVPLLIRVPGRPGRLVEAEPDQIDVAPLILSLAGIENAGMTGTGLDPTAADGRSRRHFACATGYGDEKYSLAADGFKLIDNTGRSEGKTAPLLPVRAPGFELFDLTRDPGERENLAETNTGVRNGLEQDLRRREGARPLAGKQTAAPDRETVDKLKALGYLQ